MRIASWSWKPKPPKLSSPGPGPPVVLRAPETAVKPGGSKRKGRHGQRCGSSLGGTSWSARLVGGNGASQVGKLRLRDVLSFRYPPCRLTWTCYGPVFTEIDRGLDTMFGIPTQWF